MAAILRLESPSQPLWLVMGLSPHCTPTAFWWHKLALPCCAWRTMSSNIWWDASRFWCPYCWLPPRCGYLWPRLKYVNVWDLGVYPGLFSFLVFALRCPWNLKEFTKYTVQQKPIDRYPSERTNCMCVCQCARACGPVVSESPETTVGTVSEWCCCLGYASSLSSTA